MCEKQLTGEMEQLKDKLEESITEVRHATIRIDAGLTDVLILVEGIVENNFNLEVTPDDANMAAGRRRRAEYQKIKSVVNNIRKSVRGFANMSEQFEEGLAKSVSKIHQLNEKLEKTKREATVDPLTGIANQMNFLDSLEDHINLIDEYAGKLSILLADIDDFKSINDSHGHPIGDSVLRLVAKTFTHSLKGGDTVARWGGDEFGVILPETSLNDALKVAKRISDSLSKNSIKNKDTGGLIGKVTLSVGVVDWQEGEQKHDMVSRVEETLQKAKDGGGNKIEK